jgi:hypothetical protein
LAAQDAPLVEHAFACDGDVILAEGGDIEAKDFSGGIGRGAGFAERGDFLEAVEVFGHAEAKGLRSIPKEGGQGVRIVSDQGGFLDGVESFKFRDHDGAMDVHELEEFAGREDGLGDGGADGEHRLVDNLTQAEIHGHAREKVGVNFGEVPAAGE